MAGSLICILFFITTNLTINQMTGIDSIWFIYPVFAVLWWPLSLIFHGWGRYREYSLVSTFFIILFLITTNYVTSPGHPWFLYAAYPVLWWPITLYAGRKAGTVGYALIGSVSTILYYSALNYQISPAYPWAIFPAFAVLWIPNTAKATSTNPLNSFDNPVIGLPFYSIP